MMQSSPTVTSTAISTVYTTNRSSIIAEDIVIQRVEESDIIFVTESNKKLFMHLGIPVEMKNIYGLLIPGSAVSYQDFVLLDSNYEKLVCGVDYYWTKNNLLGLVKKDITFPLCFIYYPYFQYTQSPSPDYYNISLPQIYTSNGSPIIASQTASSNNMTDSFVVSHNPNNY